MFVESLVTVLMSASLVRRGMETIVIIVIIITKTAAETTVNRHKRIWQKLM